MPYKSDAQRRKFHVLEKEGKIDPSVVREFDAASKGLNLPERTTQHDKSKRIESPRRVLKRKHYSGSPYVVPSRMS